MYRMPKLDVPVSYVIILIWQYIPKFVVQYKVLCIQVESVHNDLRIVY